MNDLTKDLSARLETAKKAALAAGQIQLEQYDTGVEIHTKSSGIDLVTKVDLACDAAISEILQSAYPDDFLLTEETFQEGTMDSVNLDSAWIIDPLDGTTNFAHSFPHFAVSIAYCYQGKPVVGVIYDPIKDELFYTVKGEGAFLEKPKARLNFSKLTTKKLKTSAVTTLNLALLSTGFPYDIASNPNNNLKYVETMLKSCHGVRRPGSAALDLAYVASGRLDGFWEITLSPWDLAAGVLLVEEAGGRCQDLNGRELNFKQRRIDIVAANSHPLLGQMQDILSAAAPVATP